MENNKYLSNHLIAYIGNKRRLLPLIEKAIKSTKILKKVEKPKLLDLFAGSGSVSRLAKSLGFKVICNDWEYYSYIINKVFIEYNKDFLINSFKNFGGIDQVLNILNNLEEPSKADQYISKYYCPQKDNEADLENERLFYTNYNGKKIDAIRAKIDELHKENKINDEEKFILIALLLYEASTRSNTSGVFKGFHKGFGGTNGDALTRIMKPIELLKPELINGSNCKVFMKDALKLIEELNNETFDLVYLDPPYNQHQYGSNYHLLNTIALNDKPPVNKNIIINGKKINKSAIRKDWINTKSSFCYKKNAVYDFEKIIKNIKSKYILISYSTDGIIEFDKMLNILIKKGKLDIVLSEYVKFRGGKQALTTQVKNIEFVLIIDTTKKGNVEDIEKIKNILIKNKIKLLIKKTINPVRLECTGFSMLDNSIKNLIKKNIYQKNYLNYKIKISIFNNKIIDHNLILNNLDAIPHNILKNIYDDFKYITNITKEDEVYLTLDEIINCYKHKAFKNGMDIFKNIPVYLSKFNNKKAYIPSLKTIKSIFDVLLQTVEMWQKNDLLNQASFKKFEKIVFIKLNHNIDKEIMTKKKNKSNIKNDKLISINMIKDYKRQISNLYDYFINQLEIKKSEKTKKETEIKEKKKYINIINNNKFSHKKSIYLS